MKVVIIGGSHAGVATARHLRVIDSDVEIIILEKSTGLAYIGSSINLYLEKTIPDLEDAHSVSIEALWAEKIQVHLQTTVIEIKNQEKKLVYVSRVHEKRLTKELDYDYLVLAMGSSQYDSTFSRAVDQKITHYKTFTESKQAVKALEKAETVAVIGAGLIGLEMAETLTHLDKQVYLIDRMDSLLFRYFDSEISQIVQESLPQNIHLLLNSEIEKIATNEEDQVTGILLTNGNHYPTDTLIYAVNPRPAVDLVADFLKVNLDGTLKTNGYLQTSDPTIYAVGDLVSVTFDHTDESLYLPLVTNAYRTGRVAATNILLGNQLMLPASQRSIVSHFFDHYVASTGMNEAEAPYFGLTPASVTKKFTQSKLFGEETFSLTLKIVFEPQTKRLLGGQLLTNNRNAVEIINTLAALVACKADLNRLATMDFYFNPKLSMPIHFLNELAMSAILKINKKSD